MAHAPVEHRFQLGAVAGVGAGHREDVFTVQHRVVGRAGLGVAAVAARGLGPGGVQVVGELDLGKLGRLPAEPHEHRLLDGEFLPHEILGHGHPAGAVRGAVGQGLAFALEEVPQVVGGALPVVHGHHDGGAAEGAVAGREHLGVRGAHGVPLGVHPVRAHHPGTVELLADAAHVRPPR